MPAFNIMFNCVFGLPDFYCTLPDFTGLLAVCTRVCQILPESLPDCFKQVLGLFALYHNLHQVLPG